MTYSVEGGHYREEGGGEAGHYTSEGGEYSEVREGRQYSEVREVEGGQFSEVRGAEGGAAGFAETGGSAVLEGFRSVPHHNLN